MNARVFLGIASRVESQRKSIYTARGMKLLIFECDGTGRSLLARAHFGRDFAFLLFCAAELFRGGLVNVGV